MSTGVIISLFLGLAAVLQGGLNRAASENWGLALTILVNNIVIAVMSLAFYFWVKGNPAIFPEFLHLKSGLLSIKWWYILPSFFGFAIVAGIPFAIYKIGALKFSLWFVAAQMIISILWDFFYDGVPITASRIGAASLCIGAASWLYFK